MSKTYKVSRVAGWDGWCSPCQRGDRPLVVTRGGPAGMLAWMAGLGDDDRTLLLTCRVCGEWQVVPAREEDDPEILIEDEVDAEVLETVAAIVQDARSVPETLPERMPARQPAATSATVGDARSLAEPVLSLPVPPALVLSHAEASLELADALAAVSLPEPRAEQPVAEIAEEPVVEAPAASLPEPRPAPERIVTVPVNAAPAFSAEAVAAAARVLSAARTTSAPAARPAPLDRTRRSRSGPTPRRTERPTSTAAGAVPPPAPAAVELPAVLGLPAGSRQVVLAVAS